MILSAPPQILEHPCCDFINEFPWGFFLVVHIALFALGSYFAFRAFETGSGTLGWGFSLFAVAELFYMTYHVNITQFLFAHTISEVLNAGAFTLLFVGAVHRSTSARASRTGVAAQAGTQQ